MAVKPYWRPLVKVARPMAWQGRSSTLTISSMTMSVRCMVVSPGSVGFDAEVALGEHSGVRKSHSGAGGGDSARGGFSRDGHCRPGRLRLAGLRAEKRVK